MFPQTVLIVEDEPLVALQTQQVLETLGAVDVRSTGTVAGALALLDIMSFDLAVLDLKLGEESGIVVAERCFTLNIPVVFATGYGDIMLPAAYGAQRLLRKPYTIEDMERTIQSR